jgi:putative selenate reductase
MSDKFHPIDVDQLLKLILDEYSRTNSIFSIPEELFFNAGKNEHLFLKQFNQTIHSPLGVAAGPHTQLSQNIIASWLMGARYIELKTIQTLDELEISKPCIDIQDEGYNCEWSQELKIEQSFHEYLNAWIVIHILNHKFKWHNEIGTIFNMSVGYNLEGILKENVQWFFKKMNNCDVELKEKINNLKQLYPQIEELDISAQISDNITLSTMHGCPANEIEDIAKYLLTKKNLHTYVKLNPTLLGSEKLREILNDKLNFKTVVPDAAFDHDLKYDDALKIISSLQETAKNRNLEFGLKLTNTLESNNNKEVFKDDVDMMYMSGRALHPISINVANKLQNDFDGKLNISFSGGADAFNISNTMACGLKPVTVCSDLLKPGGYMRLNQYFENINHEFLTREAKSIDEFILNKANKKDTSEAILANLGNYSESVVENKQYRRENIQDISIKTDKPLDYFDCISAPCSHTCATNQDIPNYLYHSARTEFDKAYEIILRTNPFPSITGMVCDHLCQNKCTRINYDDPLLIREVKRFISEQDEIKLQKQADNGLKVAVVGAGPSGLSCAYYLALAGYKVDVLERNSKAGGMVQFAIPGFRLTDGAIEKDFKRVTDLGVKIHFNTKVDADLFSNLKKNYNYIYVGVGAQLSAPLNIDGNDAEGMIEPLQFLFDIKKGNKSQVGNNVVIIGGGNTAMDAARTAYRVVGESGKVSIVYRRTVNEMPADQGEIKAVLEEGMEIIELTSPERVVAKNGKVAGLLCSKMKLGEKDASGRQKPVKIEGSVYEIPCDTIIPAVGQALDIDFTSEDLLQANSKTYKTKLKNVFIGGDALRGASTAINAIGDGRKTAEKILKQSETDFNFKYEKKSKQVSKKELILKRAKRIHGAKLSELDLSERKSFKMVANTLPEATIIEEASRCLYCDEICNICTTVCPNFANFGYEVEPVSFNLKKAIVGENGSISYEDDKVFEVTQKHQILNIANFCNECGNCNTFCPTSRAPYKDKPKFHLTISSFNEAEEGFYFANLGDRKNLIFKQKGNIKTLTDVGDEYIYETDHVLARFNKSDFSIIETECKTPCVKQVHFYVAAEMSILMKGAENLT